MNAIIPFKYQDVTLKEACWIDRKPYFTGKAIGEWLEAKHADRYVHKIVERNQHILQFSRTIKVVITEGYSKRHWFVNLTNQSDDSVIRNREAEIRVYDPIGLQLIVMESNLPKAIQYKIAVAHLVWAYMNGELKRSNTVYKEKKSPPPPTLKPICPLTNLPVRSHERMEAIFNLAREKGLSKSTIYWHAQKLAKGEPIYKGRKGKKREAYIEANYDRLYEIYTLRYERRLKLREVAKVVKLSMQTVCKWLKYFRERGI